MNRLFCIATIGAIFGIIMGLYLKSMALFILIFILFFTVFLHFTFHTYTKKILIFIIFTIAFFVYICFLENNYNSIYSKYDDQEVKIKGIILSEPEEKNYTYAYKIKIKEITNLQTNKKQKNNLYILCYVKKDGKCLFSYGDEVTLLGTFKKPNTARNEGGFDYSSYLKTKKVVGSIKVNSENINLNKQNQENFFLSKIHEIKQITMKKINSILPKNLAGICNRAIIRRKESNF